MGEGVGWESEVIQNQTRYLQVPGLNIRIYEKKQKEKTLTGLKAGSDSYLDRKM